MKIDPNAVKFKKSDELLVELGANVLVEPYGGVGLQFRTEFVGMYRGRYVAIRLPVTRQILDALPTGRQVNCRFLQSGGVVCGFQSQVLHLMVKPFPILFVSYPRTFEVYHLRRHDRVLCYIPVVLFQQGMEAKGVITDISSGGCRVFVEEAEASRLVKPGKDEELSCLFSLFDTHREVLVNGLIKAQENQGGGSILGLAFKDATPDVVGAIDHYVAQVKEHLGA